MVLLIKVEADRGVDRACSMLPVRSTREDNSVMGPLWQRIPGEHGAAAFRPEPSTEGPGGHYPPGRFPPE